MKSENVLAIISLILSIIGLASCIFFGIGAIFGVIALVLGIICLAKNTKKKVPAIMGIVLGTIGIFLSSAFLFFVIVGMTTETAPIVTAPNVYGLHPFEAAEEFESVGFTNISFCDSERRSIEKSNLDENLVVLKQNLKAGSNYEITANVYLTIGEEISNNSDSFEKDNTILIESNEKANSNELEIKENNDLSQSEEKIQMPDLSGESLQTAIAKLESIGLINISLKDSWGSTIDKDSPENWIVKKQSIKAGKEITTNQTIKLTLKKQKINVVVPNFIGLSLEEAKSERANVALTNVEFKDEKGKLIELDSDEKWIVKKQSIKSGKSVDSGKKITLTLEKVIIEINDSNHEESTIEEQDIAPIEKSFLDTLKEVMDEELAEKVNEILVNEIGFSDLEFRKQLSDTCNYEMSGSNIIFVVTAVPKDEIDDEIIRVFVPNSGLTFYEDGQVLYTAEDLELERYHRDHKINYYVMAMDIVENSIKSPNKVNFPDASFDYKDIGYAWKDDYVAVQAYVDVKNDVGTYVRYKWLVEFNPKDVDNMTYEVVYINIDGQESGNYVDIGTRYSISPY